MTDRLTSEQITQRAGRALHKIDLWGPRGLSMVTFQEIEALAMVAALAGVAPIAETEGPTS